MLLLPWLIFSRIGLPSELEFCFPVPFFLLLIHFSSIPSINRHNVFDDALLNSSCIVADLSSVIIIVWNFFPLYGFWFLNETTYTKLRNMYGFSSDGNCSCSHGSTWQCLPFEGLPSWLVVSSMCCCGEWYYKIVIMLQIRTLCTLPVWSFVFPSPFTHFQSYFLPNNSITTRQS